MAEIPVSTNIYYHNLGNWQGKYWRIYFYAGSVDDLTVSDVEIQFPHDFISNFKIKRSFDNDMPVGLELMPTLELELNINSLTSTVRGYILATESATAREAYINYKGQSVTYKVPNRWVIKQGTDGITYDTLIFEGVQERIKQYTYKPDGIINIVVTDMLSTILKNITVDTVGKHVNYINYSLDGNNIVDEIVYWAYNDGSRTFYLSNSNSDWETNKFKYTGEKIDNLMYYFTMFAAYILAIWRRNDPATINDVNFTNSFMNHWLFYKQDYTDYNTAGEQLAGSDIDYINSIYVEGTYDTLIGGCMSETESEASWGKEYKNCHNLFKNLAENFLCKIKFIYNADGQIYIVCSPIFNDLDYGANSSTALSLNSSHIFKEWEITQGSEYEQSISHVVNGNEETDVLEFIQDNNQKGQDEGSYETKIILHNGFCNARLDKHTQLQKDDWYDGTLSRLPTLATVTQSILYKDATIDGAEKRLVKVSEKCSVFVDATVFETTGLSLMNPNSDFDFYSGSSLKKLDSEVSTAFYKSMGLERSWVNNSWLVAWTAKKYLCTKKQAIIKFKTTLDNVNYNNLGFMANIDIAGILGYSGSNFESNNPNSVITSIEVDNKGIVNVTAFIRGD